MRAVPDGVPRSVISLVPFTAVDVVRLADSYYFVLEKKYSVNISNAVLFGLETDLHITAGTKYNTALTIFFVPYIIFEVGLRGGRRTELQNNTSGRHG